MPPVNVEGTSGEEPLVSDERRPLHHEHHYSQRAPWVRAAVLGACDGVVTVGALITGIASAKASQKQLLLGACSGMMSGKFSAYDHHLSAGSWNRTVPHNFRVKHMTQLVVSR
jgi:VIT1/CCC1 family predicted Fe2+/Mn2+ transporter